MPQRLPHVSIVAVSRNDDHGGDMRTRMQFFVDGFIAQCRRHQLNAELILVEWNPPPDRPPLEDALTWPSDFGPASVRIVTVPPDLHRELEHSADLPLFQMIGKNVGIRRARGQYVLATNVDILFDDGLVRYLTDSLQPGIILRVDRYDVPSDLPRNVPFEAVLSDCAKRFYHVSTRFGIFDVGQRQLLGMSTNLEASVASFVYGLRILGLPFRDPGSGWLRSIFGHLLIAAQVTASLLLRMLRLGQRYVWNIFPLRRLPIRLYWLGRRIVTWPVRIVQRGRRLIWTAGIAFARLLRLARRETDATRRLRTSRWLHTWACGDFTLLSRQDWFTLRGYPEWPMYSWHIDSALMFAAHALGLRQVILNVNYRIYHIDHAVGSGWSPDGVNLLFARLEAKGIPYLSNEALREWQVSVANNPATAIVNDENWGYGHHRLPERYVLPGGKTQVCGMHMQTQPFANA